MKISRRGLLGAGVSALGATALGAREWGVLDPARGKWAKNVIFCVSDGMAVSVPSMVDEYRQLREGKPGYWAWLMSQPGVVNGLQETRSLSSVVTDSAAAASTWGSGRRIWNGMLNMYPDGTKLATLTQLVSQAGMKCGLVTTTRITHATPAGFAVQCFQRDREDEIAELYLSSGVDVLLGGGSQHFDPATRKDKSDLFAKFRAAGFDVVKTRSQLEGSHAGKVLGTFSSSHVPYTVDRDRDDVLKATVPPLAQMAKTAIDRLIKHPNGFLLQIEGGKVDHANHANDAVGAFNEQIDFELAVKEAIDFAVHDGETLVIVTADHATGGIALNGSGTEYWDSTAGLLQLGELSCSFDALTAALGKTPTASFAKDVFKSKLGLEISDAEAKIVENSGKDVWDFGGSAFFRNRTSTLGMVVGNHTKVGFTSGNHTSDHVLVSAYGPGADLCGGVTRNTDFNKVILDTRGLRHDNPVMDLPTAKAIMDKLRAKDGGLSALDQDPFDHGTI